MLPPCIVAPCMCQNNTRTSSFLQQILIYLHKMSATPPKKPKFSFKHKKSYHSSKKAYLESGQRGFLATCNFHENDCVREALNVLEHYADELYGPTKAIEVEEDTTNKEINSDNDVGCDIADELQKEIDASKAKQKATNPVLKPRFRQVLTGVPNCVFITTTLLNPVELGMRIITDVAQTGEKKTRYLLRLVPVDIVCHANMADIVKAGNSLFDKYFLKETTTFAIVFNKRYNNSVKRDDVIQELAGLVQTININHRVDLKNPERTIVVEIIKGLCCISVLQGYLKYKKYNLVELASSKKQEGSDAVNEKYTKGLQIVRNDETDEKPEDDGQTEQLTDETQVAESDKMDENIENEAGP
ncbi:THUMP domain-containing protein 1 homolog [Eurosta solidaginis]|uniref:THUMP domain-containing protein 1 homolog n=1 Tax=Eurosta solidaginis TaxID=178769 RepID=UPI0035314288